MNHVNGRPRTLETVRDVAVIAGVVVLCGLAVNDYLDRRRVRETELLRFTVVQQALARLDAAYGPLTTGDVASEQQAAAQSRLMLEYQKLLLQATFLPRVALALPPGAPPSSTPPPAP